jgi:predicted unusual protein kinase regulating ubiquinone biosynthesis (AarF/ABC1/UbiB family)
MLRIATQLSKRRRAAGAGRSIFQSSFEANLASKATTTAHTRQAHSRVYNAITNTRTKLGGDARKVLFAGSACLGFAAATSILSTGSESAVRIEPMADAAASTSDSTSAPSSYPFYRLVHRFFHLSFTFLPAIILSPLLFINQEWADWWISVQLKNALERAGPAFIKYAQWAATRPDLFSRDVCSAFQELQTKAPEHDWSHTRDVVEGEFGVPVDVLFAEFDRAPVASGSVAQVHRAVLSREGALLASTASNPGAFKAGSVVAVKVRHPDVKESIELDFELMNFFASSTEKLIRWLNNGKSSLASAQIKESLMQFGAPMREQIDLRSEAKHLESFAENFQWGWARVRFPLASSMVSEDVLVESFETGDHISEYLDKESTHNASLANLGLKTYLKMLIHDNLIHADLHPGNILVHLDSPQEGTWLKTIADLLKLDIEIPRIVLLDVGMTTRLTDAEQGNLVQFFDTLTRMDGQRIAESILSFADAVDDATGFKREMHVLFEKLEPEQLRKNTQAIIGDMMVGIGTSTGTRSLFARPDSLTRATRYALRSFARTPSVSITSKSRES